MDGLAKGFLSELFDPCGLMVDVSRYDHQTCLSLWRVHMWQMYFSTVILIFSGEKQRTQFTSDLRSA